MASQLPIYERQGFQAVVQYEGSGIGLSMVQQLVRLHGGTVKVASEVSVGTTFTVTLPTGSSHLPSHQISENER